MEPSIYLVNPASDFPTYFSADAFKGLGFQPATLMADLAITTVAALAPHDFRVAVCDENITAIDFDTPAPFVGITGKITQAGRMATIAAEFRRRGKQIIIGGPHASLSPEAVRPHCDVLVRGEIESIAPRLYSDLREGAPKSEYVGSRPELGNTDLPRWDLYPNARAIMGTVQTSRGCPFECEFCDVIQYLGRKQRHKPIDDVIAELEHAYSFGYRVVFLADDNFTVYRARCRELLKALRHWNRRPGREPVTFYTQVSIDAAKDGELLQSCAEAGLTHVFIGIESPNEASLKETKKRQNLNVDLIGQAEEFVKHGIAVTGGMIVGFDSDGPDIFERQLDFAMASAIPVFSVGALVAPAATPLFSKLAAQGRIVSGGGEVAAMPWTTNIIPRQMTTQQLVNGIRWLCNRLYDPAAFGERLTRFISKLGKRRDPRANPSLRARSLRSIEADGLEMLSRLPRMGAREERMWTRVRAAISRRPDALDFVMPMLIQYVQIRFMYERGRFWNGDTRETRSVAEAAGAGMAV